MKKKILAKMLLLTGLLLILPGFSPSMSVIYSIPGFSLVDKEETMGNKRRILVNIPSYRVNILEGNKIIKRYRCRVGSLANKTITGKGYISDKFKPTLFRYSEGEKAGEIIEYSRIRDFLNGKVVRTIKMPYDKICGLEIRLNGTVTGQIFHSTTNPETLEYAYSHGCMGLSVDDMVDLYEHIPRKTPVTIVYEPVEFHDGVLHFYKDVYSRGVNYRKRITSILKELEIAHDDRLLDYIEQKGKLYQQVTLEEIRDMAPVTENKPMQFSCGIQMI